MKAEEKRYLTLGFLLVLLLLILFVFLRGYWRKLNYYHQTTTSRSEQLTLYRQQMVNKPELSKELTRIDLLVSESGLFLQAASVDAAGNELLRLGQRIITDVEGEITTTKVNRPSKNQKIVSATFNFILSNEALVNALQQISASKPLLNIVQMDIKSVQERKNISDKPKRPIFKRVETGRLNVVMTLESYLTIDSGAGAGT